MREDRNLTNWTPRPSTVLQIVLFIVAIVVIVIASYWIGEQTSQFLPKAAAAEATGVDALFRFELIVASIITFSIAGILLYSAIVFRRKRPDDFSDGPPIEGSVPLEIIWTVIPVVLVTFLSVYAFTVYREIAGSGPISLSGHFHVPKEGGSAYAQAVPAPPIAAPRPAETKNGLPPVEVGIEAFQWGWTMRYPNGITSGELHLPAGREVRLTMRATDVIHAFWVPEFRIQQYIFPGRTTQLRLLIERPGQYVLHCNMLCGTYHSIMRATVVVESPEAYNRWLATQKQAAVPQPLASPETTALKTYFTRGG